MSKLEIDYIESKTIYEPTTGCLLWVFGTTNKGYGMAHINGKPVLAHRLSYSVFNGNIPKGKMICHSCDTKQCVNPRHLFLGTAQENITDMLNKKRGANQKKKFCPSGHPYRGDNLIVRDNGNRECKACVRRFNKIRKLRHKLKAEWKEAE